MKRALENRTPGITGDLTVASRPQGFNSNTKAIMTRILFHNCRKKYLECLDNDAPNIEQTIYGGINGALHSTQDK